MKLLIQFEYLEEHAFYDDHETWKAISRELELESESISDKDLLDIVLELIKNFKKIRNLKVWRSLRSSSDFSVG